MSLQHDSHVRVDSWRGHVEVAVWTLFVAGAVGDVGTTLLGLHGGLAEAHPLSDAGIALVGVAYMFAAKLAMVAVAYALWRRADAIGVVGVATLGVYQVAIVAYNTHLLVMGGIL